MKTNRRTKTNAKPAATPGFACEITMGTELGMGILIGEYNGGTNYRPIGACISVSEAAEIAESHHEGTRRGLKAPTYVALAQMRREALPTAYVVWAQGLEGDYMIAARITITEAGRPLVKITGQAEVKTYKVAFLEGYRYVTIPED